jgi:hypothetical protein
MCLRNDEVPDRLMTGKERAKHWGIREPLRRGIPLDLRHNGTRARFAGRSRHRGKHLVVGCMVFDDFDGARPSLHLQQVARASLEWLVGGAPMGVAAPEKAKSMWNVLHRIAVQFFSFERAHRQLSTRSRRPYPVVRVSPARVSGHVEGRPRQRRRFAGLRRCYLHPRSKPLAERGDD